MRCREGLTAGWPPSGGDAAPILCRGWLRRSLSSVSQLPFLAPFSQIWIAIGGGCACRCRLGSARAEKEDDWVKWQRWGRGVWQRSYKALRQLFHNRGFLGNRSCDLRLSEFSDAAYGPLHGLSRNRSPRHSFIATVGYHLPNNH